MSFPSVSHNNGDGASVYRDSHPVSDGRGRSDNFTNDCVGLMCQFMLAAALTLFAACIAATILLSAVAVAVSSTVAVGIATGSWQSALITFGVICALGLLLGAMMECF